MEDDIVARIGFKSGVVEISEDVLCKHTILVQRVAERHLPAMCFCAT